MATSLYDKRGVSAQKEDVHNAVKALDQGLYAQAFCKIYPDYLGGDSGWVNVSHADGAGTKSIIAYMYWKETGDLDVWKGIAQDAIVMNLDDMICAGIHDNFLYSSTIDRNKKKVTGDAIESIINGNQEFFDTLKKYDINIHLMGGETADVGDAVRTVTVNGTMTARWPKDKLVTNDKIAAGDIIVGLASFGQARYETAYNSGLGSNGLTSARHDILNKYHGIRYPESVDPELDEDARYVGSHSLVERMIANEFDTDVGHLILSPTRTYAPIIKPLLENHFDIVHGLVHCSGGGQTKCMKYLPGNFRIVKDNLFSPPPIFQLIQAHSAADDKEMYQVFNMGHRLEVFTEEAAAKTVIDIAESFGVQAQVIGHVEAAEKKELIIRRRGQDLVY